MNDENNNDNNNINIIQNNNNNYDDATSMFHYDWTFSTPFIVKSEGGEWIELDESGIRMELLKDQTIPILFFDDINSNCATVSSIHTLSATIP